MALVTHRKGGPDAAFPVADVSDIAERTKRRVRTRHICGFNISRRFVQKSCLVLILHTSVTVFEELFFATPGFHHGFFLSLCTFSIMSLYTALFCLIRELYNGSSPSSIIGLARSETRRILSSPKMLRGLGVVFLSYGLSTSLSKVSLAYVSMPMHLVLKSAKIIPVMIGGVFITGKKYSSADYTSAAMLAAGVAVFSFAGGNISSQSKATTKEAKAAVVFFGNALLFVTLCCDALLGNFQEKVMRENGVSPLRMMLLQALFGSCLALACAIATGELYEGIEIMRGPYGEHLGRTFVLYAACLLSGTVAVLSLVEEFGAAAAVVVTLLRKCTSMMLSFVIWPKPLSSLHIWGAGLVFLSPLVHGWLKPKKKAKQAGGGGGDARHAHAPASGAAGGAAGEEQQSSLELGGGAAGVGGAGGPSGASYLAHQAGAPPIAAGGGSRETA